MFNVKRIGSTVEITQIPREVSIDVFKEIAAQTEANECLICFSKDSDNYEVIIRHDNDNMAGAVAWLTLEAREPVTGDADTSTIGKRIGVMRVKQRMSAQELEEAIGAPEGSVFRWEVDKEIPSWLDLSALASVLKCEPEWLQGDVPKTVEEKKESLTPDNIRSDFIVIGGFWKEVARLGKLNYLAVKSMYENNDPLCNWHDVRINKLTSMLMDGKTQNAVKMIKDSWDFHL